ncbi:MAG: hypothetical protein FIB01_13565 [Gemmatimonadetes bacterium]|nr:hypothetical protein [Gemmatimonadota bacterium]
MRLNETPVCYSCFWDWQPAGFRAEYVEVMRQRRFADSLLAADARFTVARVAGDSAGVCAAADAFAALAPVETHPIRHLLALETVAFTAAECGRPTAPPFRAAAAAARAAGERAKADVYEALAAGTFRPLWQLTPVARHLVAPRGTQEFVLGASAIRVDSATRIVSQMERVARDWLSYQLRYDFQHPPAADPVLNYHEGARLRDVTAVTGALPDPATGTILVQIGARWLAPDSAGVFRFEVLPDKVQYPTTRSWRGVALLVDTHGISSLVDAAQRAGADLVVGCGDYPDKMQAAAYLAARGIDVYFPTDRFVGDVLGYQGSGTLIGSAPVRREGRTAVIGDRPVPFRVAETIVVEGSSQRGEVQYYDAPRRYLLRLAETLPLRLEHVHVDAPGQAERVIARARELGAQAVALKVGNDADAAPVRAWLAESRAHRAVLFHSAAYPAGDQLFTDFPGQTTFGDPRPVFR